MILENVDDIIKFRVGVLYLGLKTLISSQYDRYPSVFFFEAKHYAFLYFNNSLVQQ